MSSVLDAPAAVHGRAGGADRRRGLRGRGRRDRSRQRARPDVPRRRRRRRARPQDLEPRGGPGGARPRGTRRSPTSRAVDPELPVARPLAGRVAGPDGHHRAAVRAAARPQGRPRARRRRAARTTARPTRGSTSRCAAFFHPAAGRGTALGLCAHAAAARPARRDRRRRAARLVERRARAVRASASLPRWPRLRAQVVHGDLNLDNVLLDEDGRIAGIVDFGDMRLHARRSPTSRSRVASLMRGRPRDDVFRRGADRARRLRVAARRSSRSSSSCSATWSRPGSPRSSRSAPGASTRLSRERGLHPGLGRGLLAAARAARRARAPTASRRELGAPSRRQSRRRARRRRRERRSARS